MAKKITISENQFRKLVESVSEISYDTVSSAAEKTDGVDFSGVKDAIEKLREALDVYYGSFNRLHGRNALSYYFANGRPASEGEASKFFGYLDEMEKYFDRKEKQSMNLYRGSSAKRDEARNEIHKILLNMGYSGTLDEILGSMSDEQYEGLLDRLPPDLRTYAENNL